MNVGGWEVLQGNVYVLECTTPRNLRSTGRCL